MFIERDGKKYELTAKELSDANTEFVTNWMKSTLEMISMFRKMNHRDMQNGLMTATAEAKVKLSTAVWNWLIMSILKIIRMRTMIPKTKNFQEQLVTIVTAVGLTVEVKKATVNISAATLIWMMPVSISMEKMSRKSMLVEL